MDISLIELKPIRIGDLVDGYEDRGDEGAFALGGNLDIRPPYQRAFIYKEPQRNAVIDSVLGGFPLNAMYWVDQGNGKFEVLDGQQRTVSICQFHRGDFSVSWRGTPVYFGNLDEAQRREFEDYQLMRYVCKSESDDQKMKWFRRINIAGEKLTEQELRNAIYKGPWLTDAKKWFSRLNGSAHSHSQGYVKRAIERQEMLETAIKWACGSNDDGNIREYMAVRQNNGNANGLWKHFESVIDWAKATFPNARPNLMKGLDWGRLHAEHGSRTDLDPGHLEEEISRHLASGEIINNHSGIYEYVLTGNEQYLDLRAFDEGMKRQRYEEDGDMCKICGNRFEFEEMEGDHITPWYDGGRTEYSNLQLLCGPCNRRKGAK